MAVMRAVDAGAGQLNPSKSGVFKGKLQCVTWLTKYKHWKGDIITPAPSGESSIWLFTNCMGINTNWHRI